MISNKNAFFITYEKKKQKLNSLRRLFNNLQYK